MECDLLDASVCDLGAQWRGGRGAGRLDTCDKRRDHRRAPAIDYTEQDWDTCCTSTCVAVFFLFPAAARAMREGAAAGSSHASMLSFQGGILVPVTRRPRSAVAGVTRALATERASLGINVNASRPAHGDGQHRAVGPTRRQPVGF